MSNSVDQIFYMLCSIRDQGYNSTVEMVSNSENTDSSMQFINAIMNYSQLILYIGKATSSTNKINHSVYNVNSKRLG